MNSASSEPKPKTKKLITVVIFLIIILAVVYVMGLELNRWWQVRKEYIRAGLANDRFPFRMYTEQELIDKGAMPEVIEYFYPKNK